MNSEDSVYNSIQKAILEHKLAPGTRLQEIKLSQIYNVKRGLVRKVLSRLKHAKLVQHKANLGAQVAMPTLKEAQDLFATRTILEQAVIQYLCQHITAKQIKFLQQHCSTEEKAYKNGQFDEAKQLSANFHRELVLMTNNNVLIEYLNDILNRTPLVMLQYSQLHPNKACTNNEHQQIIGAIDEKECDLACKLMNEHMEHLSSSFKQLDNLPNKDISLILKNDEFKNT